MPKSIAIIGILAIALVVIGSGVYLYGNNDDEGKECAILPMPPGINTYTFGEFADGSPGSNQTWEYSLSFLEECGIGGINLSIDGFQTMTRLHARGTRGSGSSIDVAFDSYAPDNMFTPFKEGDVLFTLTPTAEGLAIEWKEMQPMLQENKTGSIFTR